MSFFRPVIYRALIVATLLVCGCASAPVPCQVDRSVVHEQLTGTLWVQTSAEYSLITQQTYRAATQAMEAALMDPSLTAALEQVGPFADKPPAIILDVDETVLDNSPFQAGLIKNGATYSSDSWVQWVARASAQWVPGAHEFLTRAHELGVAVFLVTNRKVEEEADTRRNLARLGAALPAAPDYLLSRNERDAWTSDKTSRRAFVARDYRVLLLIGDDLNDFTFAAAPLDERQAIAATHAGRFGTSWFMLPNPVYGSWERALVDASNPCAAIEQQRSALRDD